MSCRYYLLVFLCLLTTGVPVCAQDNIEIKLPTLVSHLPKANRDIIRMKGAPKHNVFKKILCFNEGCRRAVGWQRAQNDRRFNDYKDVPQVRSAKRTKKPAVEAEIHTTEPPAPQPDTAQIKKVVAPKPDTVREHKFVLSDVLFDVNSPTLKANFTSQLDTLVDILRKNTRIQVKITGHTDNTGREAYNQRLSTSRAEAVGLYLIEKGIYPERIQFEGKGSTQPIADNTFEEGRRKNRRVEIILRE